MDIHVVKPGDTLYSIALSHGVPMSRLLEEDVYKRQAEGTGLL